jgi:hypothetical protein
MSLSGSNYISVISYSIFKPLLEPAQLLIGYFLTLNASFQILNLFYYYYSQTAILTKSTLLFNTYIYQSQY